MKGFVSILILAFCPALLFSQTPPREIAGSGDSSVGFQRETVLTQVVFRTQALPVLKPAPPVVPWYKVWLLPGAGQIALGRKARGAVQACVFSGTLAASLSFFIAGGVNWKKSEDKYAEALAEIDYSARSNLLVQRDDYYNRYNILTSYGEAALVAAGLAYAYCVFDFYYTRGRLSKEMNVVFYRTQDGCGLAYKRRF